MSRPPGDAAPDALRLQPVTVRERHRLQALFQYYLYDMAEFTAARLSSTGEYKYPFEKLDPYWQNPEYHAYFAFLGNELVGFALVRPQPDTPDIWDMEQFFILRHHRRRGLGQALFYACLERHPGLWQIRVMMGNIRAWQFWTSSVKALNPQGYTESELMEGSDAMKRIQFTHIALRKPK